MGFTGSWIFWERGWDSGSVVFPCPWSGACDSSRGGRAHRPSLEREGSSLTRFGWTFDSYQDCLGKANGSQPRGWYLALPTCASSSGPRLAPGSIHPFLLGLLTLSLILLNTQGFLYLPILSYVSPGLTHLSTLLSISQYALTCTQPPVQPFIQLHILSSTYPSTTFSSNHPPIQLLIHLFLIFSHFFVNSHPSIYYSPLYPSIPTYLFIHVLTHHLSTHSSIIYISIHHFTPPLTHPHIDPFFLAPIYIPIYMNVNPLSILICSTQQISEKGGDCHIPHFEFEKSYFAL